MHTLPVRIYWEDTDAGGIVYHASHVRFFERGRTELLRALGLNQSATADRSSPDALLFIVRRLEIDYLKPAYLDEELQVLTAVETVGRSRLVLRQRLMRGEVLIAEGLVTVVCIGGDGRPKRIAPELVSAFAAVQ